MGKPLRVLILEDNPADVELVEHELKRLGYSYAPRVAATRDSFRQALQEFEADIVLSDYNLPGFDGIGALALLLEHRPDTPLLFVTGSLGEERAVETMKIGATDYVLKDRLGRLGPAMERALAEAQERQARKQALAALEESERRNAEMIREAPDPIIMVSIAGIVESVNPATERACGYAAEELIGRHFAQLGVVTPESALVAAKELAAILMGQERPPREYDFLHKNGTRLIFEANQRVLRREGRIVGLQVIFRDVTARRRAERRLATQYAIAQTLAQATTIEEVAPKILRAIGEASGWPIGAVWSVERHDHVLRRSVGWCAPGEAFPEFERISREITFSRGAGLPGRVWASGQPSWIPDVTKDKSFPRATFAQQDGLHAGFAFPITVEGGVVGVIEFFHREVRQPDEDFLGAMRLMGGQLGQFMQRAAAQAALKSAQAQLIQAEKLSAIGRLASGIAHEVKNPLGIILQGVSFLEMNADAPAANRQEVYQILREAVSRADGIVRGLLTLSRPATLKLEPGHLHETVESAVKLLGRQAEARNVLLRTQLLQSPPLVRLDANQMQQVFMNLLLNALDAMPQGGRLTVRSALGRLHVPWQADQAGRNGAPALVCEVADTGTGIPRDQLDKVMEPFFTTKPPGVGTGLGLAIVHAIVEQHQGTVTIASEEGRGTTVTIALPITKPEPR